MNPPREEDELIRRKFFKAKAGNLMAIEIQITNRFIINKIIVEPTRRVMFKAKTDNLMVIEIQSSNRFIINKIIAGNADGVNIATLLEDIVHIIDLFLSSSLIVLVILMF
ncbi:hypothetical protein ACH5RR_024794 [Cinchona calisaya]|uniref:Uncharacterized protein n=1 Tax=Cinchona calisaya TaxID=153742 RepID=A0ABD2Z0Z3_9GENT